jgi:hypothetical protein
LPLCQRCILRPLTLLAFLNTTSRDELDNNIHIIQQSISTSVHYQDVNSAAANMAFYFCVDYMYFENDGLSISIKCYESNVTILVDLAANFTLMDYTAAGDKAVSTADLDYPMKTYISLNDNSMMGTPSWLTHGCYLWVDLNQDRRHYRH